VPSKRHRAKGLDHWGAWRRCDAGQDDVFDQEPEVSEAVDDAMAFFIARYVPAWVAVTTV